MTEQQAINEVLANEQTEPLDLLNKWWAGQVDNSTMYVLMQRHLLAAKEGRMRLADPLAFAKERSRGAYRSASPQYREQRKLPDYKERQLIMDVCEKFRNKEGKFAVSDAAFEKLLTCLKRAVADGFRIGHGTAAILVAGIYTAIHNYDGGKEFTDELDRLVEGNFD